MDHDDFDPGLIDPDRFSVIMHFDPMMVAELAMGADHPHDIAERYGVDPDDYDQLASQEWFQRLVAQKRQEYHDTGVLFTAKAAMMAEALLTRLFQQSMIGSIPAPLTVEVAKQLTDIGRLKPQPLNTQPGAAGGAFQINIQVNGNDVIKPPAPALVAVPTAAGAGGPDRADPSPVMTLDFPVAVKGTPPPSITNIRVPDFDTRHPNALVGNAAAQAAAMAAVPVQSAPTPGLPPKVGLR